MKRSNKSEVREVIMTSQMERRSEVMGEVRQSETPAISLSHLGLLGRLRHINHLA